MSDKMPSDTCEKKPAKPGQLGSAGAHAPPPEPQLLPCPRCDSTNTKFCYYNNYNFSQPRHFCKSCRRYWTHGGALRDIPVGGGSRKNAKRCRTTAASTTTGAGFPVAAPRDFRHLPASAAPVLIPFAADHGGALPFVGDHKTGLDLSAIGSFSSLLSMNTTTQGNGLFGHGGFGLGIGHGRENIGFALGNRTWPFAGVVEGGPSSGGSTVIGNTWQLQNGENGFAGSGDCFNLPDLAISAPGNGMK